MRCHPCALVLFRMPVLLVTGYLFDSSGRLAPCRAAALAAGAGVAVGGGPAVRPSSGAAVRAVPLWRLAQAQRCVAGVAPLPLAGGSGGRTTGGSTRPGAAVCRSPRPLSARAPTRRACVAPRPCCCGPGVAPGRVWPCPPPVSPCGCAGGPRLPRRRRHSAPADFFIAARRRPSHRPRRVGSVLRLLAVALAAPARRRPTRRPRRRPPPWWRRRRCCTCTRLPALPCRRPCGRRCSLLPRRTIA